MVRHRSSELKKSTKPPITDSHPEVAAQAHGWDPATVTSGSGQVRTWRCDLGHVTATRIADKCKGIRCPVCSGKEVSPGFNDLKTVRPEIAAEADGWDPTTVTYGSKRIMNWKCAIGHTWSARVYVRSNGVGCPVCSNREVLKGFNDLATTHPHLAEEVDGWDASSVTATSQKKERWKCKLGHTWIAEIKSRGYGAGCPVCDGKVVLPGFNDLVTTHPKLASQAHGWDPTTVSKGSGLKRRWKCELGHLWEASVGSRSSGTGCPVCSNHQVLRGHNDLASKNPEVAKQADGWDPSTISPHSSKKMPWICPKGHRYTCTVAHRSEGKGCPFCAGRQVLAGFNDLATTHPDIASQAHGWDPTTLSAGSHRRQMWKCSIGHVWDEVVSLRTSNGYGCSICSGKRVLKGFNDLATTHPEIANQADGWDPTEVSKGHNKKKNWKCELGHQFTETVNHRTGMKSGCPICAGKKVLVGFNDLATTSPSLASEAFEWDPTTVTRGSSAKKAWRCHLGHVWTTSPSGRLRGEGCPSCSRSGFDPNKSGWLYLIDHLELEMLQIGITNSPKDRLKDHSRRGWELIEVRGPLDGHLAQNLETACLHSLERRGAVLGHKALIQQFDGYSEAWLKSSLEVASISQILEWVYQDEEHK
jgi:hypothetical protein